MEWIGWLCFVILLYYSSYPSKVKKLERKMKKLEKNKKGDLNMSRVIKELVGKNCSIRIDADDEWIKQNFSNISAFVSS